MIQAKVARNVTYPTSGAHEPVALAVEGMISSQRYAELRPMHIASSSLPGTDGIDFAGSVIGNEEGVEYSAVNSNAQILAGTPFQVRTHLPHILPVRGCAPVPRDSDDF